MTKILLPLLLAIGLALGLYLLVSRRRVEIPEKASRLKVIILLAAAAVIGSSAAGADKEGKIMCYKPAPGPDDEVVDYPYIDHIMERIGVLEALHAKGKLTDDVYYETLSSLKVEIEYTEKEKKYAKKLGKAEKKFIDLRRAMDKKLEKKLIKKPAWVTLKKQTRQLHKLIAGKTNTYSQDVVDEVLDELQADGLIEGTTNHAVSVTLSQVASHYKRAHSGKTCYKPSMLGMHVQGWRGKLTALMQSLKSGAPSKKQFAKDLGTLALGVSCLGAMTTGACEAPDEAGVWDRIAYVQALDILIAMSK
jgi:hypothetical protein